MIDRLLSPADWYRPLESQSYTPPQTKWDYRLDIAPFRAILAILQSLSDLWTLTTLHARNFNRKHSPIRYVIANSLFLSLNALYYAYHFVQFLALSSLVFALTPALIYDALSRAHFACRAFYDSFADFNAHVCRAHAPHDFLSEDAPNKWLARPWHLRNRILDQVAEFSIWILDLISLAFPGASLRWRSAEHRNEFRQYLRHRPPAFAVRCHDYPYLQDSSDNPCQIIMLAVLERMDLGEARKIFHNRWVAKHPKLRSVVSFRHGRYCWVPLPMSPNSDEEETAMLPLPRPEDRLFRMGNHMFEATLDLSQDSIYAALSKMASVCLRRDRPLWRVCLFQPTNANMSVRVGDSTMPATSVTFLGLQIHHSMADGVGLVHAMVTTVFDPVCVHGKEERMVRTRLAATGIRDKAKSLTDSCSNSAGQLPYIYVASFYVYHFIRSLFMAAGQISFWFLWAPVPPALFQNSSTENSPLHGNELRPRSALTGRRFLTAPVVFSTDDVLRLCADIEKLLGVRPTLNDLFSACLSSALGRLRQGQVTEEVKRQLLGYTEDEIMMKRDSTTSSPRNRKVHVPDLSLLKPFHHYASDFENYAQLMIPMTARVSVPRKMDNFTSLVLTRFPLPSAISEQEKHEREAKLPRRLMRFVSGDPSMSLKEVLSESAQQPPLAQLEDAPLLVQMRHLLAVKSEMDWLKDYNARAMFFTVVCAMCRALPDGLLRFLLSALGSKVQMFFTNVWGPSVRGTIAGRSILSLQSWPPLRGDVTLAVKLLTYGKELQLLIAADECEAASMFSADELRQLSRKDLLAATSVIGQVVWQEYQKLKRSVRDTLSPDTDTSPTQMDTTPACATTPLSCANGD